MELLQWKGGHGNRLTVFIIVIILIVLFLCHQPLGRSLLGEVILVGERLGLVFSYELATIVFPFLIMTLRNKVAHIATIIACPHTLLALGAT